MPRPLLRVLALSVFAVLALVLAACGREESGGGGGDGGGGGGQQDAQQQMTQGKRGGKLTVLSASDVDFMDPGQTYYQWGFVVHYATQKPLYSFRPNESENPTPDLADGPPEVSPDGKRVTVRLKPGVRFSPPVDREVTSADVKYAIERGFFTSVTNGYAGAYFGTLRGAKEAAEPGRRIAGIQTPDERTVVFNLTKPTGRTLAGALALPLSAPVPREYALEFDRKNPTTYGEHHVATGPYMVENDADGELVGYRPGRRIHLVRNPNWDRATDYRPAYVDEIDIQEGNEDATVASRRILNGQSMISGDNPPPPAVLKQVAQQRPEQLTLTPPGGTRYVSLNTKVEPFDDLNVRKAVLAVFDRNAMRLARGGAIVGDIPTHFIPPQFPGYDEAGGAKGFGLDYLAKPEGDPALAAEYMRKAGYETGRYEGNERLLMVGTSGGVAQKTAETAQAQFEKLGFKTNLRLVTHESMYTKYCGVPKQEVAICPNTGWFKDFPDPITLFDPTFNGENILPAGNVNWPQLDVPQINRALNDAAKTVDPAERARAYAQIDRMVMEQAPIVPWIWDKTPNVRSANVNGVASNYYYLWDLSHTSLR